MFNRIVLNGFILGNDYLFSIYFYLLYQYIESQYIFIISVFANEVVIYNHSKIAPRAKKMPEKQAYILRLVCPTPRNININGIIK